MKEREYLETIDSITPSGKVKEEMREQIFGQEIQEKTNKKSNGRKVSYWKVAAASLALLCVAGVSVPAIASEIQSHILSQNPSYTPLNEAIETAVYTQSDGHIQVTAEELLTDGIVAYMTVRYTALDETGEQWLASLDVDNSTISLQPYMPNTREYGTNYSYGTTEIEENESENERAFMLFVEASGRDYCDGKGVFRFPLTQGYEEVELDISGNVEIRSFKLSATQKASEYYTPTYLVISPISFVVYAENHGVYERKAEGDYTSETWLLPDEEIDSLEDNTYFVMKDGSKEMLGAGAHNATYPKEANAYSDVMLYSGAFEEYSQGYIPVPKLMDLDAFEAIVINGVRFEFTE